jgi:hypothetical protein
MTTRSVCVLMLLCSCAGWASACGSSGTFRDGTYQDDIVRYRIGSPQKGWERVEVDDNDVAYHHREFGTISANSTCTDIEDVPEQALLNHLFFGTRERVVRKEETVTIDGRGALHVIADIELDGVPITLEVYMLKKDGCVYDLSYISGRDRHAKGRGSFVQLVRGFRVLETNLPD